MHEPRTIEPAAAQPSDLMRIALRSGGPIKFDFLDLWSPPDVEDTCDRYKADRYGRIVALDWSKKERSLKDRFGGILLSYKVLEQVKSQAPSYDAFIIEWIRYNLNVSWALYSRAVFKEDYQQYLADYVLYALMHERRFNWPPEEGGWLGVYEAAQLG
jgi:hypothetical protein